MLMILLIFIPRNIPNSPNQIPAHSPIKLDKYQLYYPQIAPVPHAPP